MKSTFTDRFVVVIWAALLLFGIGSSSNNLGQTTCSGSKIFSEKNCVGDANSAEEKNLLDLINSYRTANKRPVVKLSPSLSILANRRMLDLRQNVKTLTHSWSNCPYDLKNEKTWPCVTDAPVTLKCGYAGQGYETLYRTAKGSVKPDLAVDAWKKSSLHNSIILNLGMFANMEWEEAGVAIDGEYAALWFGYRGIGGKAGVLDSPGLGVSYEQAVAGLTKILKIDQASSTVDNNKWQGYSADKKIKLEIYGNRKDISEANLAIAVKLESNKKLSPQSQIALSTLLKNLFPEWTDRDVWVGNMVAAIASDRTVSRTKFVRKNAIELRADGPDSLKLTVQPESQKKYIQVF